MELCNQGHELLTVLHKYSSQIVTMIYTMLLTMLHTSCHNAVHGAPHSNAPDSQLPEENISIWVGSLYDWGVMLTGGDQLIRDLEDQQCPKIKE